jgi:SNF2 family DNA or RNA helicase
MNQIPPVLLERKGSRIWLTTRKYDPRISPLCQQIAGAAFSKRGGAHWTFPLTLETCRALREEFGNRLRIGADLDAWARREVDAEAATTEVHRIDLSKGVDLPRVRELAPTMWAALERKSFQTIPVRYGVEAKAFLNASEPGCGKTIETLGTLVEAGVSGRVLVAAPRTSVRITWVRQIERWMEDYKPGVFAMSGAHYLNASERYASATKLQRTGLINYFLMESGELKRGRADLNFLVVNPEMLRARKKKVDGKVVWEYDYPGLFDVDWDAFIGDELHKYLVNASTRAKSSSAVGMGFNRISVSSGIKIGLTGTPAKGRPLVLWSILNWLRPREFSSKWNYSKAFLDYEENRWAESGVTYIDRVRPDRKSAFDREVSRVMIRHTKAELREINPDWMPPDKIYEPIWLDLDPKQAKQYDQFIKHAALSIGGKTLFANGVLAELTRLKQFAQCCWTHDESGQIVPTLPSAKLDWILEFIAERDSKIVIASQFTSLLEKLYAPVMAERGIDTFVLTGNTPDEKREEYSSRFLRPGGPRVFLLNTQAGGVSIDLDSADDLIMNDKTFVPDEQIQVEDRVHRAGRTGHQVRIWEPGMDGTIERDIAALNDEKGVNNHLMLDAPRGLAYARAAFGTNAI